MAALKQRGVTLVELLIAMALSTLLLAGAVIGLSQAQTTWQTAARQARLHERAQYVFATLEPELQMAGYFGAGPPPAFPDGELPAAAARCGTGVVTQLLPPVAILENWTLPCAANGGGALSGNDVLILRRASSKADSSATGQIRIQGSITHPSLRQIIWPGIAAAIPDPLAHNEIRDLLVRIYYIARAADGELTGPALRVKSLTSIAGTPAFIDTEVLPGVDDLQIELLPNAIAPRSVLVSLRVAAEDNETRTSGAASTLSVQRTFALRNIPVS